jgi:hypothetical protein
MRTNVLIAVFAWIVPVVAVSAVAALVAHRLVGSWVWGVVAASGVLLAYALLVARVASWSRKNPGVVGGFTSAMGRAMVFNSGGWESRKRSEGRSED